MVLADKSLAHHLSIVNHSDPIQFILADLYLLGSAKIIYLPNGSKAERRLNNSLHHLSTHMVFQI